MVDSLDPGYLSAPSAVQRLDRAGMEELLRCHHSVFFVLHSVFHHELDVAQRVDVAQGIAGKLVMHCLAIRPSWNRGA
jgi:hypothetical protein